MLGSPSGALFLGSATDESLMHTFGRKIETGKDEPTGRVVDKYVAEFDGRKDAVDWGQEEVKSSALRDEGIGPLKKYHAETCPSLAPVAVQPDLGMRSEALGITVVQFGDVEDAAGIIDIKTSKKSPNSINGSYVPSDSHLNQMTWYGIGYKAKHGRPPRKTELHYLVHTQVPKVVPVAVTIDAGQVAYVEGLAARLETRLGWLNGTGWKGMVPNRKSFLCSRRYCNFWRECQQEFGGKVKE